MPPPGPHPAGRWRALRGRRQRAGARSPSSTLPSGKLKQLKAEIEKEAKSDKSIDLEKLLLSGPIATKKQLEIIAKNRIVSVQRS